MLETMNPIGIIAAVTCLPLLGTGVLVDEIHVNEGESVQTTISSTTSFLANSPIEGSICVTDIPQMPGWPIEVGGAFEFYTRRGLIFVNLDGDDTLEIIAALADHQICAWDLAGNLMPGFPVSTFGTPRYPPSAADMDGDGDQEIVQFTAGVIPDGSWLHVIDHTGAPVSGFPLEFIDARLEGCPTLFDLDDDGLMEIVAAATHSGSPNALHIIKLDGTEWGGDWPVSLDGPLSGTVAVGDVDADGSVEILCMSTYKLHLLALDGTQLPGWPLELPGDAAFGGQAPVLADVDADHDLEIVIGTSGWDASLHVLHHDGTAHSGWPISLIGWPCSPTVTDLEGDGELEVLIGEGGQGAGISAFSSSGTLKPGFPYELPYGGGLDGPLTVADINGDGLMEIFADSSIAQVYGFLFGVDASGSNLPGFPLRPWGATGGNGASIGDVDADGDYELGVLSVYPENSGATWQVVCNLYDLADEYVSSGRDWKVYHGSNRRGGLYPTMSSCMADITDDDTVDVLDLLALLGAWGPCPPKDECTGDIDMSGEVDVLDLMLLLAAWGPCP